MANKIILFDGFCNLCSGTVQFIIKNEKSDLLRFSPLQSETGMRILKEFQVDPSFTGSVVFIEDGKVYVKSRAALKIAKYLRFPFRLASLLHIVPGVVSDGVYDIIARKRHWIFGRKKTCWIPRRQWEHKFL